MAGSITIRELLVGLGVRTDDKKLDRFNSKIGRAKIGLGQAKRGAKVAGKAIVALSAAVAAAGVGLFALANNVASLGDQFAKDSKKIGISAEALQELSFAAERAGSSGPIVVKAFQAMAKQITDARIKGTGPFTDQLDALGISIREFDDLSPEQAFERLADVTAGIEDPMARAAFAQDVFGRGGKELVPLLLDGAAGIRELREEAQEYGVVMSEDATAQSEIFKDRLLDVQRAIRGLKATIGAELLPVIADYLERARDWIVQNREIVAGKLIGWVRRLTGLVLKFLPVAERFAAWSLGMVETFGGLEKAITLAAAAFVGLKVASIGAALALGPYGALAGAFIFMIPLAIELGDAIGDALADAVDLQNLRQFGGKTGFRGGAALTPAGRRIALAEAEREGTANAAEDTRQVRLLGDVMKTLQDQKRLKLKGGEFTARSDAAIDRAEKAIAAGATKAEAIKAARTVLDRGRRGKVKPGEAKPGKGGAVGPTAFGQELQAERDRQIREAGRREGARVFGAGGTAQEAEAAALEAEAAARERIGREVESGRFRFAEDAGGPASLRDLVREQATGLPTGLLNQADQARQRAPVSIAVQNFNVEAPITVERVPDEDRESVAERVLDGLQRTIQDAALNLQPVVSR